MSFAPRPASPSQARKANGKGTAASSGDADAGDDFCVAEAAFYKAYARRPILGEWLKTEEMRQVHATAHQMGKFARDILNVLVLVSPYPEFAHLASLADAFGKNV